MLTLAGRREVKFGNTLTIRTPILVPSFSSRVPKVENPFRASEEFIDGPLLISAYDVAHELLLPPYGTSEQPSMLRRPGNFDVHRPRTPLECLRPYRNPPFTRLAETLRPGHRQPFAVQIQVHQREAGAQSMMVLLNPSVSHLLETEDALQNPKRMFHLRSHSGLYPVPGPL